LAAENGINYLQKVKPNGWNYTNMEQTETRAAQLKYIILPHLFYFLQVSWLDYAKEPI
jgi:hypothetical protein